jgi:uncharacterized protein YbjT (DUF2867 family)
MSNKPTILVLGATGKVGSETVRQLLTAGDSRVLAAVRSPEKAQAFEQQGIETALLDLDRPETILPALKQVERTLLLTGYSVDMLRQSKRFLDEAKKAGVKHIVHIGASGALTNEVAHWGWHQYIEAYIEQAGFSFTHLRPEAFMQNITAFGWLKNGVITHYIGNTRWSWIDCDDLARVVVEALRHPKRFAGQTIPLGYDARTFDEVAEILTEVVGQPFRAEAHSPEEFLDSMLKAGADPTYINCIYTQFKLNIAGAIPNADATFDNFESITGYKPTTWHEFAAKHRAEFAY